MSAVLRTIRKRCKVPVDVETAPVDKGRIKIKGYAMAAGPHIVVMGNEKGGTGKSTTAVHIATACVTAGLRVGAIDLDQRQRSFARYMENRAATLRRRQLTLPSPEVFVIGDTEGVPGLVQLLKMWGGGKDVIVIDTPGRHGAVVEAALVRADTLVTPINDSFVDLDLMAHVDPETWKVKKPSFYAELVWDLRKKRARADGGTVDWVVLRNRLAQLEAKNMRRMMNVMAELSKKIGFRVVPGLSERVIYRELFPAGLTLLDPQATESVSLSHIAARQELRELMQGLAIPAWDNADHASKPPKAAAA